MQERKKQTHAPRRSLSRGSDRSPSSKSSSSQKEDQWSRILKSRSFFDIFFRYKKSLHSLRAEEEEEEDHHHQRKMFAIGHSNSLVVVGASASSSAAKKASSRSRSSFSRSMGKISIASPKSNPTSRRRRKQRTLPCRARVDEDDEEMDFERPPPPPGPENEAMESETFSNAWKAGFVVLSVLGAVSVFSLASPVLRVMTETFPAGRGPQ